VATIDKLAHRNVALIGLEVTPASWAEQPAVP